MIGHDIVNDVLMEVKLESLQTDSSNHSGEVGQEYVTSVLETQAASETIKKGENIGHYELQTDSEASVADAIGTILFKVTATTTLPKYLRLSTRKTLF